MGGGGGRGVVGGGEGAKCQVSRAPPVKEQQVGLVSTLRTGARCAGLVGLTSSAYAVLDRLRCCWSHGPVHICKYKYIPRGWSSLHRVQELCESRGGRPGLSVLTSLMVSVDVKQ